MLVITVDQCRQEIAIITLLEMIPGTTAGLSAMMKSQMEKLITPTIEAFLELVIAGGGEIYACKLAVDMFGIKKNISPNMLLALLPQVNFNTIGRTMNTNCF